MIRAQSIVEIKNWADRIIHTEPFIFLLTNLFTLSVLDRDFIRRYEIVAKLGLSYELSGVILVFVSKKDIQNLLGVGHLADIVR